MAVEEGGNSYFAFAFHARTAAAVLTPGCLEEVIEAAAVQIGERVKG